MNRLALGVDGCRRGWVVASGSVSGGFDAVQVVRRIDPVMELVDAGTALSVAVDMPIGLADAGKRCCDHAARMLIGSRRSSVFSAPARAVLGSTSYADACARSRVAAGVALSRQSWNLIPKIAELDGAMTIARQQVVVEAHPEGSFAELAGQPCRWPKRAPAGRSEREGLLARVFPAFTWPRPGLPGAAPDDILDALILLWTAQRRWRGEASWVGDEAVDSHGLRMQVWR